MQIELLVNLTKWFDEEIKKPNIQKLYQNLQTKVDQLKQVPGSNISFAEERERLDAALRSIHTDKLTTAERNILRSKKILQYIGGNGADTVVEIMRDNNLDLTNLSKKLATIAQRISEFTIWSENIKTLLTEFSSKPSVRDIPEDLAVIEFRFERDSEIANVADLKDGARDIYAIFSGLTESIDEAPETVRLLGASNGSIIFEFSAAYVIAKLVNSVIGSFLKNCQTVMTLRIMGEQLKGLQLANAANANALNQSIKEQEDSVKAEAIENAKKELGDKALTPDQNSKLEISVDKLVTLLERGCVIDIYLPPPTIQEGKEKQGAEKDASRQEMMEETRTAFEKVRRLRSEYYQITHKTDDD